MNEPPHEKSGYDENDEDEIVVCRWRLQIGRRKHPLDSIISPGEVMPFKDDEEDELAKGQRQDGEIDPPQSDAEKSDDEADQGCHDDAGGEAQPEIELDFGQEHGDGIAAKAIEGGLTEGELPREAKEEIEAESQHRHDEGFAENVKIKFCEEKGSDQENE